LVAGLAAGGVRLAANLLTGKPALENVGRDGILAGAAVLSLGYGHCAEFGFIVRYKTEWVKTTGYKGEPWHIRYVGREQAQFITKLNVPFDTYMAYLQLVWDNRAK
jgi:hypothetical protein